MELVVARPEGLYCPPGDFYIDPWRPVPRAVITHAHADHARTGHTHYLAAAPGAGVLRSRLGDIALQAVDYGESVAIGDTHVSLHPAGHVLGSAQVRIAHRGEIWVASGDYKTESDPTCSPFEAVRCHTFITESTFGLPIYRWDSPAHTMSQIDDWWRHNASLGLPSILFCYAFGKAQRVLASIDATIGPIFCHGAVEPLNQAYRDAGVLLPPTRHVTQAEGKHAFSGALVLAPPSAAGSAWMKRFGQHGDGFASGWMRLRGARRRRGVDRGFVLSDHADWPGLQSAIAATGAQRVIVTHGQVATMVRWLGEQGLEAGAFSTEYGDEDVDDRAQTASASNDAHDAHDAPDAHAETPDAVAVPDASQQGG